MSPELTDTHCHIQSLAAGQGGEAVTHELWAKAGDLTPEQVIKDAKAAGVTRLICVGCDLADSRLAIVFVKNRENTWASIGIHPHEAKDYAHDAAKRAEFSALTTQPKVVAVGECGLDYFYAHSPKEDQLAVLKFQIELALENDLPMTFHVREAFDDFWPVFDRYHSPKRPIRGVLHSFTDSQGNLEKAVARGLYIGVNGIATFAKKQSQIDMYRAIPQQHLLLETDAPFLTPIPYRGSINEPKQVRTIAGFVAQLRGEDFAALAIATNANAQALFGI